MRELVRWYQGLAKAAEGRLLGPEYLIFWGEVVWAGLCRSYGQLEIVGT